MLRFIFAVITGKLIQLSTKMLQKGGGTAAPGLYALKIDPNILERFSAKIPITIMITGTNGKTTTARAVNEILKTKKLVTIHNRAGSNLERGIVSTCIEKASWLGNLPRIEYAIWETDEAAFVKTAVKINPKYIVLTNIFRDQLDRYGEVDATKNKWIDTINKLKDVTIIYNSDDAALCDLINKIKTKDNNLVSVGFSLNGIEKSDSRSDITSPVENILCPQCRSLLMFKEKTVVGMGKFNCSQCGFTNKTPDSVTTIISESDSEIESQIKIKDITYLFTIPNLGIFNIYNTACAITLLSQLTSLHELDLQPLRRQKTAFGRFETIQLGESVIKICLIKNPTGCIEILKAAFKFNSVPERAIFILNDNFADGKDVSWIWDVPFEKYIPEGIKWYFSGTRLYDSALRLKYSGISTSSQNIIALNKVHTVLTQAGTTICFTTYTGLLWLQNELKERKIKKEYWKE